MDQNQLIQLIEQLDKSSLAYLNYETQDVKVTLSKEMPTQTFVEKQETVKTNTVESPNTETTNESVEPTLNAIEEQLADTEIEGQVITSPMVGVVYLQPSPDKDPFVKVGDQVAEGDTVVIVEAMKLMNEIQSNLSGIVVEILVENETVVEYGQPLIRIK
ncbi:acetyl-CoA carboxylase biotin carboxyl carrier protein [Aerococcaceae bacterium WGS1372]